jgi:hypothetical protein
MTWEDLAAIQQAAAQYLFAAEESAHDRAICGRAYYAAYALITSRLPAGMAFAHGWNNPPHAKLPTYIDSIRKLKEPERREVRRAVRRLRQRREDADYRPGITVDRASARESMRDARQVFAILAPEAR